MLRTGRSRPALLRLVKGGVSLWVCCMKRHARETTPDHHPSPLRVGGSFFPKTWVELEMTENGGWTRATLAKWGVPWPPPKGWKKKLEQGGGYLDGTPTSQAPRSDR